ncbi:unnamed protein product [Polarella glacialis]|uniref:Uncharacterized protein n=1 Tax=Polarella glacialis TaxID=89957 RepID=A0A813KFF8_POLGL|nr:unnamed protein product [Polarella glacialis]CAE8701335.1 unnamed protein product [Polarella glacialis]
MNGRAALKVSLVLLGAAVVAQVRGLPRQLAVVGQVGVTGSPLLRPREPVLVPNLPGAIGSDLLTLKWSTSPRLSAFSFVIVTVLFLSVVLVSTIGGEISAISSKSRLLRTGEGAPCLLLAPFSKDGRAERKHRRSSRTRRFRNGRERPRGGKLLRRNCCCCCYHCCCYYRCCCCCCCCQRWPAGRGGRLRATCPESEPGRT